jgi:hypothetical protein
VIRVPAFRRAAARPGEEGQGWLSAVKAATVRVFEQPGTWPVGLAGFLARGGIVPLLIPIVPLPSPVGLANIVGPTAATPSGPSPEAAGALAVATAVFLAWLVLGSAVGALADAFLAGAFGAGGGRAPMTLGLLGRLVGVRLIALIPLGLALAIAARPLIESTYRQLISPYDLATPLVSRVVREVAPSIGLVVAAWLLAEVVAGLAVRSVVLNNDSPAGALGHAIGHFVRRPASSLATAAIGLAGLAVAIGPPMVGASSVWSFLQAQLAQNVAHGGDVWPILLVGLCLVAIWTGGLVLCGVASAWRGLLWTAELARSEPDRREADPDVRQGPG